MAADALPMNGSDIDMGNFIERRLVAMLVEPLGRRTRPSTQQRLVTQDP